MDKAIKTVLLAVLLVGCQPVDVGTGMPQDPYHGFGDSYDGTTDLGIKYRLYDERIPSDQLQTVRYQIDQGFINAAACVGATNLAPNDRLIVIVGVDFNTHGIGDADALSGRFYSSGPLIIIDHDGDIEKPAWLWMRPTTEHEFVHYFLHQETGNPDGGHESECYTDVG